MPEMIMDVGTEVPAAAVATVATTSQAAPDEGANATDPKSAKMWLGRIERCKKVRKTLVSAWSDNVDYRRGKPFHQESDEDRVNVNLDWSFTKSKHAQLYSQTPQVYLKPKQKQFEKATPVFAKQLNDTLEMACVGAAMDESVLDAINASGIGAALVGYQALTEAKLVPEIDPAKLPPEIQQMIATGTYKIPMVESRLVTSFQYYVRRISPSDILWDVTFTGSNYDDSAWIGRSDRMLWSEAQRTFELNDEDKEKVLSAAMDRENLRQADEESQYGDEPVVEFDEIYYWAYRFDASAKYFKQINRIVFIKGLTTPVAHGPWDGQKFLGDKYIGSCKFPIRLLTLTYISDDAIPPSDTAIGRPQIEEMIKSRTQIILNRDRSQPMRWADVNRLDPMVIDTVMRGDFQAVIPVQGDGSRVLGEVARASYPREDFEFDAIIKQDLQEQWQIGPNQAGTMATGRRSASEANIVQQNFQTRVGYERARVAAFFTGIAEVMGGLIALYGDFPILGEEEIQAMDVAWDRASIGNEYVYKIRPDTTVLLDSNQRMDRIERIINITGQSGFVNLKPLISEYLELAGNDADEVIVDPQPPPTPQPSISYRFSGVEDLTNPLVVALLMKTGQMPNPQELEAAKILLASVSGPPQQMVPPAPPDQAMPQGPAHPDWGLQPKVAKRQEDIG